MKIDPYHEGHEEHEEVFSSPTGKMMLYLHALHIFMAHY